ncbi:MAG: S41 family peptidase [Rhodobacteraceae bacterium]|jgi:hypothetical protein|nr:S41 family peptidase [Paracoccaceae bacterium]
MFATDIAVIRMIAARDTAMRRVPRGVLPAALGDLAATTTPDAFALGAMRLMALGGNGHTRAIPNTVVRCAPLRMVWLADGPCVVEGPLAGARFLAVNGVPVAEVFRRLRPYLAGTDARARSLAGLLLAWPPAIAAVTDGGARPVVWTLEQGGRVSDLTGGATVPAATLYPVPDRGAVHLLLDRGLPGGALSLQDGVALRRLPGDAWYLRIADLAAAPPATIARRLRDSLGALRGARGLIVDLRGNPGGSFFGAAAFARALLQVAPHLCTAVLVDTYTFSAAIVTAALLKVHAGARLVGEEMGDSAAFHAEGGTIVLPQSRLAIRHSDGWHDWATGTPDPRRTPPVIAAAMVAAGSLVPDVLAAPTAADLLAGRDVALAAARVLVAA